MILGIEGAQDVAIEVIGDRRQAARRAFFGDDFVGTVI